MGVDGCNKPALGRFRCGDEVNWWVKEPTDIGAFTSISNPLCPSEEGTGKLPTLAGRKGDIDKFGLCWGIPGTESG